MFASGRDLDAPSAPLAGSRPALLAAAAAALLAAWSLYYLVAPGGGVFHLNDDQMISLRVARNFWLTGAPYYNAGEPVAANTSLFWVLLISPLMGLMEPEPAVRALYLLSGAGWVAGATLLAATQRGAPAQIATLALIALSASALKYAGSGWEHLPQAGLVTFALWRFAADDAPPSARALLIPFHALALSFLIRPDSAVLIAGFFLVSLALLSGRARWRFVLWSLPALAIPAVYAGAMLWFYGDLLPNTAYLKVGTFSESLGRGLAYVADPRSAGIAPLLALALGLAAVAGRLTRREALALALAAAHVGYVVAIGGDVFSAGRFLLIVLPFLAWLFVRKAAALAGPGPAFALAALIVAVPLLDGERRIEALRSEANIAGQLALARVIEARLTPADGAIGLHYLGIGYHLPAFDIVDFLGKADPVVARGPARWGPVGHNKWDYAHSLGAHDVAAIPIHDDAVRKARGGRSAAQPTFFEVAAQAIDADGRYLYLPPDRFCGSGYFGLYVRRDLASRFDPAPGAGCPE